MFEHMLSKEIARCAMEDVLRAVLFKLAKLANDQFSILIFIGCSVAAAELKVLAFFMQLSNHIEKLPTAAIIIATLISVFASGYSASSYGTEGGEEWFALLLSTIIVSVGWIVVSLIRLDNIVEEIRRRPR